jgi:hypothetical protein
VADVCFAGVFGETWCAERDFLCGKTDEVVVETWLEMAVKSWRKNRLFFTFLRLFPRNF